jgi:hypothetical protein
MTNLDKLNALLEAKSLKHILIIDPIINDKVHFMICVRMGSYVLFYGTYTQSESFIKGFREGLTESKQLKAYDIHF